MLTTPTKMFSQLAIIRERLALIAAPIFISVHPRTDSQPDECIQDVTQQVNDHGGEIVYGWIIWLWPRVMAEAQFHAVWRDPAGDLLDVSYKQDAETRILFITDPTLIDDGQSIDNCRVPIANHSLVHEFIAVSELFQKRFVETYGAHFTGEVVLTGELATLYARRKKIEATLLIFQHTGQL